jgi:hypothetical protein
VNIVYCPIVMVIDLPTRNILNSGSMSVRDLTEVWYMQSKTREALPAVRVRHQRRERMSMTCKGLKEWDEHKTCIVESTFAVIGGIDAQNLELDLKSSTESWLGKRGGISTGLQYDGNNVPLSLSCRPSETMTGTYHPSGLSSSISSPFIAS